MSEIDPADILSELIFGHIPARAVHAAAELGLADLIAGGATSSERLAEAAGVNAGALRRLMRYLVSLDVFDESENGYALKPMGGLLRSDGEGTQQPSARLMGYLFPAWVEVLHTIRTGEAGYSKYYGKPLFDHIAEDPERATVFDAAMTAIHGPESAAMLDACDFSDIGTVIDVGGGNGSLLTEMLLRYPSMKGVLFDLPHVAERALSNIEAAGLGNRCRAVGGNFFEAIPDGADAIVLRHVIHDWSDEDAVSILTNCARALSPGGRVLIVEMIVPVGNEPSVAKRYDLSMMLLLAGVERTEAEYGALFQTAGLELARITPTASPSHVIEARPAR